MCAGELWGLKKTMICIKMASVRGRVSKSVLSAYSETQPFTPPLHYCNPCSVFHNYLTYPNRLPVSIPFPKRRFSTTLVLFISTASHVKLSLCIINLTSCGHRHHGRMELEVYVFLTSMPDQPIVIISLLYSTHPRNF